MIDNRFKPAEIRVNPGKAGELVWEFTGSDIVNFACPLPRHYKGMRGRVIIEKNEHIRPYTSLQIICCGYFFWRDLLCSRRNSRGLQEFDLQVLCEMGRSHASQWFHRKYQ